MLLSMINGLGNSARKTLLAFQVYSSNLLYYFKFDVALDASKNLLNTSTSAYDTQVVNNATITSTTNNYKVGTSALSIPTNSDYINMAGKLDFRSSALGGGIYSLSMWFKTSNTNQYTKLAVFSINNSGSFNNTTTLALQPTTGIFNTYVNINNSTITDIFINPPTGGLTNLKDAWYHVVWCGFGNTTTTSIYVNGVLWGSGSGGSYSVNAYNLNATGTFSRIGSSGWDGSQALSGYLDDVQIYRGTLSATQILAIYNAGVAGNSYTVSNLSYSSNLLYYYNCDEELSSNKLYNSVTSLYDATVLNGSISTSVKQVGTGSLNIPDSTAYIDMSSKLNFSSGTGIYSLSMWFRTGNTNTANLVQLAVFSADSSGGFSNSTMIRILSSSNNSLSDYTKVGTNATSFTIVAPTSQTSKNLRDGLWHHLVWSGFGNNTNNTRTVYIDGVLWGSGSGSSYSISVAYNVNANGTSSRIGSSAWASGETLTGYVDDIQIYNRTLTSGEVTTIYNAGVAGNSVTV